MAITQSDLLLLDHPPFVVLDQLFCTLDDREEVVLVRVVLAQFGLGSETGVCEQFQELYLLFGEVGMPEVYDEDQSGLFAFMPGLVLKTIIKHIGLSLLLHPYLIAYPHPAAANSGQRQVEPQLFIGRSVVLHDMRILCECTDEGMVVIVRNVLFDHLHNEWYLLTVVIKLHVVQL